MAIQGSRPPNDRTIAPNLIIRDVEVAIDFYERALGAEVLYRGTMPNGVTLHAQLRIGQGYFLLSNEIMRNERMPTGSPETLGGVTAVFEVFVDDVDGGVRETAQ